MNVRNSFIVLSKDMKEADKSEGKEFGFTDFSKHV